MTTSEIHRLMKYSHCYGVGPASMQRMLAPKLPCKFTRNNARQMLRQFKAKYSALSQWLAALKQVPPPMPVQPNPPLMLTQVRHAHTVRGLREQLEEDALRYRKLKPFHLFHHWFGFPWMGAEQFSAESNKLVKDLKTLSEKHFQIHDSDSFVFKEDDLAAVEKRLAAYMCFDLCAPGCKDATSIAVVDREVYEREYRGYPMPPEKPIHRTVTGRWKTWRPADPPLYPRLSAKDIAASHNIADKCDVMLGLHKAEEPRPLFIEVKRSTGRWKGDRLNRSNTMKGNQSDGSRD